VRACGALVCGGRRRLGTSFHRDSSFTAIPSQRRARESLARLCEGVPGGSVCGLLVGYYDFLPVRYGVCRI
jgi:hypothetical protein